LSDFDARQRFVLSATYDLPFTGHPLTRDWQVAAIVQSQSGNPVNLVTSDSTLNGVPNTVRPDVTGPIRIIGSVDQWFDPSAFVAVDRFGNLGRNVVIGPSFHDTDLSVIKNVSLGGRMRLQVRADVFDLAERRAADDVARRAEGGVVEQRQRAGHRVEQTVSRLLA
jgi:hypothetical protein